MNTSNLTFTANDQELVKNSGMDEYASNTVSYIKATFTLGTNWSGFDSVRAVWSSYYNVISTVLDTNNSCMVPAEMLLHKSKVQVNLVGSIVEGGVLTDRLTTFPVEALKVSADAKVSGSETVPVTPSQFEQFVDSVEAAAQSVTDYSYDSEAWAKGTRGGTAVSSSDPTYHNNSKYWNDQGAALSQEVTNLKSDLYPRMKAVDGQYSINKADFDIGNISISTSGWSYNSWQSRVRTKQGHEMHLKVGDVIHFTDYSTIRYYLGWKKSDDTYGAAGWLTDDYTVTEEGDYVFLITPVPEVAQSSVDALLSRLIITSADSLKTSVNGISRYVEGSQKREAFRTANIFTRYNATEGKYISSSGTEGTNPKVGHTDYIDISDFSGELILSLLADPYGQVRTYQGAFYDADKNFISGIYKDNVTSDIELTVAIPQNANYLIFDYLLCVQENYYIKATTKKSKVYDWFGYGTNIFTTDNATSGYYARATDGELVAASEVSVTDYLDTEYSDQIVLYKPNSQTHQGAFYDKNHAFVGGYTRADTAPNGAFTVQVPAQAKYIRISYANTYANQYYANLVIGDRINYADRIISVSGSDRFSAMKMNCLGDSITYGYIPDSGAQMAKPYPALLKEILGLSVVRNYGISGSTLAVNSGNYDPMVTRYTNMDNDADIVLVFGGTNDYGRATYTPSIGTITDSVNTTIYGALNILCEGLITKYPKALIFLCTPLKRADKTSANGGGYTLEDVADAIRNVGAKFGMPVLDLNHKGGFYISNATFRAQYGGNDKLHPNQAFDTEYLAPMIARFIESTI